MVQGSEIIIILLVALVVLGPRRLPDIARKLGRWSVELRQAAADLRRGLEEEVGDLRDIRQDLEGPIEEARREFREAGKSMDETAGEARRLHWVGPEPKSGPTPADAMSDLDEIEGEAGEESSA